MSEDGGNDPQNDGDENAAKELDIGSDDFNPLRALYTADYRVTKKTPKVIYQNLAAFESAFKKFGIWNLNKTNKPTAEQAAASNSGKLQNLRTVDELTRRFEPHQLTVKGIVKKRHQRNLYTQMEGVRGPLAELRKCLSAKEAQRVRVLVRKEHGVRGTIEGELIAFDKQWNLLLRDVIEVWQRRKYKYSEQKICGETQDCSAQLELLGIELPVVQVKSLNRKNVQLTRELPQLLLRGEQIVLISYLSK